MHSHTDGEMAIPRVFNSNTPFIIVSGGSELTFLSKEENNQGCEEEKESLVQAITPHLGRVMQHGTAKHMVTQGREESEENPCVSIVAQAEREDFQEFSPTITQGPFSRSQQLKKLRSVSKESAFISDTEDEDFDVSTKRSHYHWQRKQRRKARTRQSPEEGGEPPVICGLWVQEIDWLKSADAENVAAASSAELIPPPPQFTDSVLCSCCHRDTHSSTCDEGCSCAELGDFVRESEDVSPSEDLCRSIMSDETSSSEDRTGSDFDCGLDQTSESICTHDGDSDSSCCAEDDTQTPERLGVEANVSDSNFDLMHVSGFNLSHVDWDYNSDDPSDTGEVLNAVGGRVTKMPKLCASPLLEDLIKDTLEDWTHNMAHNEGLIFHHQLQPRGCQYREGEEYSILHHIQNGSYGDVFCVQDKRTGFKCAAKRIPLSHFSCEEVSTWSALNSPRVVELFGAVREGPNIVLFMDLKPACLAQLLKDMKSFPEDLALHYLLQTLGALEHLHNRSIIHLDIKVDNVLLSADCRDTFLCDFGLSETLDSSGRSNKAFRGVAIPGTQTHMAPEVARGDQLCAKADVWSSCCMLLHMLNGCHPWIRYYSHPLCLQIVNKPPPLWEVPSTSNNFTAQVFRAGLQKEPDRRASAKELRRKTMQALRAVGGLSPLSMTAAFETLHQSKKTQTVDTPCSLSFGPTPNTATGAKMHWVSPWRTTAVEEDSNDKEEDLDHISEVGTELDSKPRSLRDDYTADEKDRDTDSESDIDMYMGEEELMQERWLKTDREYEGDWEEEGQEEEEEEDWHSSVTTEYLHALRGLFPLLRKGRQTNDSPWRSEAELEYLRDDVPQGTVFQTPSPEPRDDPPSCFSCSDTAQIDASEKDSEHSSDDLSSGVFSSCNSQTGGHLQWLVENQLPSHCFDGVDIWIENVQGECLRIREHRQVKVGHVAIGISEQISGKAFTLETLDRKLVSFDEEINESCMWFRCIPAPDTCHRWTWRIKNGKLELQE